MSSYFKCMAHSGTKCSCGNSVNQAGAWLNTITLQYARRPENWVWGLLEKNTEISKGPFFSLGTPI